MKKEENNENIIIKEEETESKDFDFILNRSKRPINIKNINEPIKIINYTYTREESYSDDIIYYLTQLNDKINQQKYKYFLSNPNKKSNFQVYNLNFTTDIDVFFEYEYFKNNIYNNEKAYNVHEHRKVPFEVENKHGKRRNYKNFEENKFQRISYNFNKRRTVSEDKYNKNSFRNNSIINEDKNNDKVIYDGINEFINFQNVDNDDNSASKKNKRSNKRKEYCTRLTSYDPFYNKKKKKFKEDDYEN